MLPPFFLAILLMNMSETMLKPENRVSITDNIVMPNLAFQSKVIVVGSTVLSMRPTLIMGIF